MKHTSASWSAIALSVMLAGGSVADGQAAGTTSATAAPELVQQLGSDVDTLLRGVSQITQQLPGTIVPRQPAPPTPPGSGAGAPPKPTRNVGPPAPTDGRPISTRVVPNRSTVGVRDARPVPLPVEFATPQSGRQARPRQRPSSRGRAARPRADAPAKASAPVENTTRRRAPRALDDLVRFIPGWIKAMLLLISLLLLLALVGVLKSRRQLAQALRRAHSDAVTGLPNRAAVDEALGRIAGQAGRRNAPMAVAMLDLDHFKSINDSYGHAKGDDVLAAVGAVARAEVRSGDFVGRFGGEEFLVVMPDTAEDGAYIVAEKLQRAFREMGVLEADRPITASFGVAGGLGAQQELVNLVPAADAALYRAKENGRDRIERASQMAASADPAEAQREALAVAAMPD